MKETKITKKDVLMAIVDAMETGEIKIDPQIVIDFAQNEITLLDNKAAKAKERAEKHKAEGDPLIDFVLQALTDDYDFTADITLRVGKLAGEDADVTVHKVQYRLTQLVKNGLAEATDKPVNDAKKRTLKAYRKASN